MPRRAKDGWIQMEQTPPRRARRAPEPLVLASQPGSEAIVRVLDDANAAVSKTAMRPRVKKLWEAHRKAYVQGHDDEFDSSFRAAVLLTLSSAKSTPSVENMLYFISLYLKEILVIPEAQDYQQECADFVQENIMFISQGLESRGRLVRRRCVRLIGDVFAFAPARQVLEVELVQLRPTLLDRCKDIDKPTRLLAMASIGNYENDKQVSQLLDLLADADPSPNGRAKALVLMDNTPKPKKSSKTSAKDASDDDLSDVSDVSDVDDGDNENDPMNGNQVSTPSPQDSKYLEQLLHATRDPSPTVRATAFRALINKNVTIQTLNNLGEIRAFADNELPDFLTNRVLRGINDSSSRVKDLAMTLVGSWTTGGYLNLLQSFGVLPDEGAALNRHSLPFPKEDLFKKLLAESSIPRENTTAWIKGRNLPELVENMTPEQATYLRIVAQNEANLDKDHSDLPELIDLSSFIYQFFHEKINRVPGDLEENELADVYIYGQLLLTASFYDLKDPASREKILHVVDDALRSPWALEWNYPILMRILRRAYNSDAEFISKTRDYLSAISEELDSSTRWDAELTITQGILENIDTLETDDAEFYNELAAPVIRCFTAEGAATIPYDMVADAMHIMGLLALAAPAEAERLLTIMAQRYSDQDHEAYEKQQEMNEDIQRLQERLNSPRLSRTASNEAREQIEELQKTRAIPETWDERRKILQIMSDVMLKHNFFHESSIQIILHGVMTKDDPELQSICVGNAAKLVFGNVWPSDTYEILILLTKIYFEQFTYERSPRSHDSYSVVYSVVEILEYFFGIYQLTAKNTLKIARQFPNAIFDAMKAVIVDIPELQKNKREFAESDLDELPGEPPRLEEIENLYNSFQGALGNCIRWASTVTLHDPPTDFTTNGIVLKMFLEEILSVQADFGIEEMEYKSLRSKGPGVHGRNATFYRVWDAYAHVLFDHLKNIELEKALTVQDLDDIIELIGDVKLSSYPAILKTAAKRVETNVQKQKQKLLSANRSGEGEDVMVDEEHESAAAGTAEPEISALLADISDEASPEPNLAPEALAVEDVFGDSVRDLQPVALVESTPQVNTARQSTSRPTSRHSFNRSSDIFAGLSSSEETSVHADIATVIASQQEQLTPTRKPISRAIQIDSSVDLTANSTANGTANGTANMTKEESDDSLVVVKTRTRKRKRRASSVEESPKRIKSESHN